MDHRLTTLQFLRSTGLIPVKVRPKQKDPFSDYSPKTIKSEDHSATLRQLENNKDLNVGGLFSGRYVDIDDDGDAFFLKPALELFLPQTPYIWGRKTNPRSHRAYALQDDFDRDIYGALLRFMKNGVNLGHKGEDGKQIGGSNYSVEVRGGKVEQGYMTLLPGSYREDVNEHVEWDANVDTSVSAALMYGWYIVKQVRLAQATAILATYFTEGLRNDMSLAIAGLLWRIRASSLVATGVEHESELPDDMFVLSETDADSIFANLLKLADPNTADRRQRELNYTNTWNKLSNDSAAKVTGGKVLADLIGPDGDKVVRALYRLLSDNDGIEQLERLAEQYVVWYSAGVLLDLDLVRTGHKKPWLTKEQATNSLGSTKVVIAGKKIPVVTLLFGSTAIQRVDGLTFDPSTTDRIVPGALRSMVNQWSGWETEVCPQSVSNEEVAPFLDYVFNILASKDQKIADWVLAWCANLFQEPHLKPGTALVLVGVQGAGKTFLGERVIGKIIGERHYAQMNSIDQLTDKFNSIADNKVFIQCDEAVHSYQKSIASKLKSLITDEGVTIEPKGIDSYRKPNHIHFLFTSNETNNPIFIDPSPFERRFTVLHVSPAKSKDQAYWSHLRAWVAMNLPKLLRWFLDHKYDKKLVIRPIQTAAKQQIQRLGVDPEVSWILSRLADGFPLSLKSHEHWWHAFDAKAIEDKDKHHDTLRRDAWPDHIYVPALEADFRDFIRQHGRTVYSGSIISVLRGVFPDNSFEHGSQISVNYSDAKSGQTVKQRVRLHSFPPKEWIIAHLDAKYGDIVHKLIGDSADDSGAIITPVPELTEEF